MPVRHRVLFFETAIADMNERNNELHLFAGAGGGILGGILLGHTCVCAVEIEPYCQKVLLQRQRDGILPRFPIWGDIKTFDGKPWRGKVDIICGGFPCQDISIAGTGEGIEGERSGLWKEMARVVREVAPRIVFVENSPMLISRGLGRVLRDLAQMGYDAKWGVFSCREVGGVHLRERIFILATNTKSEQCNGHANNRKPNRATQESKSGNHFGTVNASHFREKRIQRKLIKTIRRFSPFPWGEDVRRIEDLFDRPDIPQPLVRRIGNDVANGMDRLSAIGNGQVPRVVELAWETLSK